MHFSKINWYEFFIIKKTLPYFIIFVACMILSAVAGWLTPKLVYQLALAYDNEVQFFQRMLYLFFLFLGIYFNNTIYQLVINKYVQILLENVRQLSFTRWLKGDDAIRSNHKLSASDQFPQGEVLARLINDTEALRELITSGGFAILIDIFFLISCLVSFMIINFVTGTVLGGLIILAAFLLFWGSRYMRKVFLDVRRSRGMLARALANIVGGLRELHYIDHGQYATKRGERYGSDFLKQQLRSNFWDASYYSMAESLYPLFLIVLVLIFPYSGIVQAAVIFALVDLIQRSIQPLKDFSGKIASIQRALTGLVRVSEFNNALRDFQVEMVHDELCSSTVEQNFGDDFDVQTMDVFIEYFSYPQVNDIENAFALEEMKFSLGRGEVMGVVGASGCGKSTLMNIIAGNIIGDKVRITLGDNQGRKLVFPNMDKKKEKLFRSQIGIVSQDSHIFSQTLEFNIALSTDRSSEFLSFWNFISEEISYLRIWGIGPSDFLDSKKLSMGQKQLLCGLRSCFLKKKIVIFDEISSGLDSGLEEALRNVLLLVQKNALTIIVAHRLETIIDATKIIFLDNGRMICSGKHHELMMQFKDYRSLISQVTRKSVE